MNDGLISDGVLFGPRRRDIAEVQQRARQLAHSLSMLGVRDRDTVALLLRNDYAFFEAARAANLLGAYFVPINWHFTAAEVDYLLRDSGAKVLVAHEDLLAGVKDGVPPGVEVIAVPTPAEILEAYSRAREAAAPSPGVHAFEDLIAGAPAYHGPEHPPRGNILYTSGTTGNPKGVQRESAVGERGEVNRRANQRGYGMPLEGPIRTVVTGPMYHGVPCVFGMTGLARPGSLVVLQPRFDAEELLALIERHRITHLHLVPIMFVRLLRLPDSTRGRYDLSSLRYAVHGAAPCRPEIKRRMIEWWGPLIHEYYGSTETGPVTCCGSEDALRKPGTVGRAQPEARVAVYDESGRCLPAGAVGEVYVRIVGYPDFDYLNRPGAKAEIGRDGLVTLGDIGYLDEDGYLFLCDRKSHTIISGGVNVYPAEIEAAICALPGVADCAVFGIPDEEYGERICAHVEAVRPGCLDAAQLQGSLAGRLAKYKIPSVIVFEERLPREDSGKIFKKKLRQQYAEQAAG